MLVDSLNRVLTLSRRLDGRMMPIGDRFDDTMIRHRRESIPAAVLEAGATLFSIERLDGFAYLDHLELTVTEVVRLSAQRLEALCSRLVFVDSPASLVQYSPGVSLLGIAHRP